MLYRNCSTSEFARIRGDYVLSMREGFLKEQTHKQGGLCDALSARNEKLSCLYAER